MKSKILLFISGRGDSSEERTVARTERVERSDLASWESEHRKTGRDWQSLLRDGPDKTTEQGDE